MVFKTFLLILPLCGASAAAPGLVQIGVSPRLIWTGAVGTTDGRVFVVFPRLGPQPNPSLAVLGANGVPAPFPGGRWNGFRTGGDAGRALVSAVALAVGPDGALWVLDSGVPGPGLPTVSGGPKLVTFDAGTGATHHVWPVPSRVLRAGSVLSALAVHDGTAYLGDAGEPGLIVFETRTGQWRRVLDRAASTTARRPALIDGTILRDAKGKPASVNLDTLAVSPDGAFLYFQPLPGPLYRVATKALRDASLPAAALNGQVEFWYNTPALGGAATDAAGNLLLTDLGSDAVLRMSADKHLSLVVRDSRLHWPACPSVAANGDVLVPVAQLDRAAFLHGGRSEVVWPLPLFKVR